MEVTKEIAGDAGVTPSSDGTIADSAVPQFLQKDYKKVKTYGKLYPARAIAIAHMTIQREMTSKMKALSLKRSADGDVTMEDVTDSKKSVDKAVDEKIAALIKAGKIFGTSSPNQLQRPRKRKREWEEEVSKEMKLLCRPLLSTSAGRPSATTGAFAVLSSGGRPSVHRDFDLDEMPSQGQGNDTSLYRQLGRSSISSGTLTKVAGQGRTLENTDLAQSFLEKHSALWNSVSDYSRREFVFRHMPVYLVEYNHDFASGIFMGPGVHMPKSIEYALAMNAKFVLHNPPNALRANEAWDKLERSVRLRWHFRHSTHTPSKFYVPKREWQPPLHQRNHWIEKGLAEGKDSLLRQTNEAALHLGQTRRSNPDLAQIHEFLRSSQFLVKLTDKNLGLAVIAKDWYMPRVKDMLSADCYCKINWSQLPRARDYVRQTVKFILEEEEELPKSVAEYLSSCENDTGVPTFHGIPKVHKETWSLRPIIPSHSWITRKLSEVADFLLRQCIKEVLPWCIESTRVMMQKIEEESIIRSEDICSWRPLL
ncbi:reverse transcriptase [Colletotrichum scovillei]|nr:reverse transcriptase [Colletotrichum scovillei]